MRKLVLALAILAVVAVPAQAEQEFRGSHERSEHFEHSPRFFEHFEHSRPFYAPYRYGYAPYFYGYAPDSNDYAPACWWQEGYWVNQPYVDANGGYSCVPLWVPGQWICS